MATAGGLLTTAWTGGKWLAKRPFKPSTYVVGGLTAAAVIGLSFAAPATAVVAAAQGITASSAGAIDLSLAILNQAVAGTQYLFSYGHMLATDPVWGEVAERMTAPAP